MGLFSTLASTNSGGSSTTSSSSSLSVPTLVQLYTDQALTLDPNVKNSGKHAVLSYQAIDVGSTESTHEELFGHKRKATDTSPQQRPDLGVWNCRCQPVALADHLLSIPKTPFACFTVNLGDPSSVESAISVLHEALIRHLISASPGDGKNNNNCTSTLYSLKANQFGLAPEDANATRTTIAPEEDDRKVQFGLIICAVRPATTQTGSSQDDYYQQTQAQNLVWYHLRRYAAALNATLCLVQTNTQENEQSALTVSQVTRIWREFAQGNSQEYLAEYDKEDGNSPIYGPGTHHEDLIESVLLRNSQCPGHWDAAKDSLWTALPTSTSGSSRGTTTSDTKAKSAGDDSWLVQLQQSLGVTTEKTSQTTPSPAPKKEDDAEVSSFFENLLKK